MPDPEAPTAPTAATPTTEPVLTLFDLVGHSIAAAHASTAASVAQLNVALAAYRLLQIQHGSLGGDDSALDAILSGAGRSGEALRRILNRDAGGDEQIPRTFNQSRPETATDTADGAGTRGG